MSGIKLSHFVGTSGHYINAVDGTRSMSIRTGHGTSVEVRGWAASELQRADRIREYAEFAQRVADQMDAKLDEVTAGLHRVSPSGV